MCGFDVRNGRFFMSDLNFHDYDHYIVLIAAKVIVKLVKELSPVQEITEYTPVLS